MKYEPKIQRIIDKWTTFLIDDEGQCVKDVDGKERTMIANNDVVTLLNEIDRLNTKIHQMEMDAMPHKVVGHIWQSQSG